MIRMCPLVKGVLALAGMLVGITGNGNEFLS